MSVVLRYVDKRGCIIERFIGVVHVTTTSILSLKEAIDSFFSKHNLSLSRLREQGYDGASNMSGEFNQLSQALQRKDQDIVNAMAFVQSCKRRLQKMRDSSGWESLFESVSSFCVKHAIDIPNMEDLYAVQGRPRRNAEQKTNLHFYHVEVLCVVIDEQLSELNNRFNECNSDLLLCMACLDPSNSFAAFDAAKLVRFAKFYPSDFTSFQLTMLPDELENYIDGVKNDERFSNLEGIAELAKKLVETNNHISFSSVYMLIKLALLLPVATASVERSFFAMKLIKNELRNRMGDDFMNDCLVTYIERCRIEK